MDPNIHHSKPDCSHIIPYYAQGGRDIFQRDYYELWGDIFDNIPFSAGSTGSSCTGNSAEKPANGTLPARPFFTTMVISLDHLPFQW
jgi:hypothetical protein